MEKAGWNISQAQKTHPRISTSQVKMLLAPSVFSSLLVYQPQESEARFSKAGKGRGEEAGEEREAEDCTSPDPSRPPAPDPTWGMEKLQLPVKFEVCHTALNILIPELKVSFTT